VEGRRSGRVAAGGLVLRHRRVAVEAVDAYGQPYAPFVCSGWKARILQHEGDHLDGVLDTDRLVPGGALDDERYVCSRTLPLDDLLHELGLTRAEPRLRG
jgi:hypothetical protein